MKLTSVFGVTLTLIVGTALLAILHPATARAQEVDVTKLDLTQALPSPDKLAEFDLLPMKQKQFRPPQVVFHGNPPRPVPVGIPRPHIRGVTAKIAGNRRSDLMHLRVQITVCPTVREAYEVAQRARETQAQPLPEGSPSGRRIGQKTWHIPYKDAPKGSYDLIAWDGHSVVKVVMLHQVKGTQDGRPVRQAFSKEDLRLAEELVRGCLERLSRLGLTGQRLQ